MSRYQLKSVVIAVIVAGAKMTGLRIDRDLARGSVQQAAHLEVFALAGDYDVRPPVGFQFRFHLLSVHRMITGNKNRA